MARVWASSKSLALVLSAMEQKKKKLFFVGYGVLGYAHLTYNFGFRVANEWREPIRKPLWFPPIRWLKPFRD